MALTREFKDTVMKRAREDRTIQLLGKTLIVGEDQAAARTAECLVCRRCHDMAVGGR